MLDQKPETTTSETTAVASPVAPAPAPVSIPGISLAEVETLRTELAQERMARASLQGAMVHAEAERMAGAMGLIDVELLSHSKFAINPADFWKDGAIAKDALQERIAKVKVEKPSWFAASAPVQIPSTAQPVAPSQSQPEVVPPVGTTLPTAPAVVAGESFEGIPLKPFIKAEEIPGLGKVETFDGGGAMKAFYQRHLQLMVKGN